MRCDLHTHSIYSDGTFTPAELISAAKALDLTIALTDHNTVSGLPEFMDEAKRQGVRAVGGVELSTEYEGMDFHVLGFFISPEHYADVEELMREFFIRKDKSNKELIERLNAAGYMIDYPTIKKRNPRGNINRAYIAAELFEKRYVESVKEAFDTLLNEKGGFYVPPLRLQFTAAIKFLRSINVLPVLAHPLQSIDEATLRRVLVPAREAGLVGLEVYHSSFDEAKVEIAERVAHDFGLLPSGGSDFHGKTKPDISLAVGKGNMSVPIEIYENLLARHREIYGI